MEKKQSGIGFFEKYLTLWVLLCMAAGILIGQYLPGIPAFHAVCQCCAAERWCSSFMPSTASQTGFHSQARQFMLASASAWLSARVTPSACPARASSAAKGAVGSVTNRSFTARTCGFSRYFAM